jgi:dTDP-4-dehydrorhamnose reductase
MVKALVFGAWGGLGRAFLDRLAGRYEVVALGRPDCDISKRQEVLDRVREHVPDLIVNAAGVSDVDACEIEKWQAYLVNRDGAKHVASAAAESGALLVQPGTDLIFDGARVTPYREEDPPNPLSIYGDTKLAAELAVMSSAPRHLVVRTGWLFGPRGRHLLSTPLDLLDGDDPIVAHDDHRSQPTHQHDFVDAVLELVKRGETGVWHVANAGGATELEFLRAAFECYGRDPQRVKPVRRASGGLNALRPRSSVLDTGKLAATGIPMRPWLDALRDYLSKRG